MKHGAGGTCSMVAAAEHLPLQMTSPHLSTNTRSNQHYHGQNLAWTFLQVFQVRLAQGPAQELGRVSPACCKHHSTLLLSQAG